MKIFAIKDDTNSTGTVYAWLVYYEQSKQFIIELADNIDPWDAPLVLSSFLKRGEKTINNYWSKIWVSQRIVPTDRQNLGQILKDNGLNSYDEFSLLMLSNGRCAQDSYYLELIDNSHLPKTLKLRFEKKIADAIPLSNYNLLVFFYNGIVKKIDVSTYVEKDLAFEQVISNADLFNRVSVVEGGNEIKWGENISIPASYLYKNGTKIPLTIDDFLSFIHNRVIDGAEVAKMLNCTRQNIDDLIRRGKLHPIKTSLKNKIFLKSEVEQRLHG